MKYFRNFSFISTPRYGSVASNGLKLNCCDIPDVTEKIQLWNFLPYGQAVVIKRTNA
jgi:hypothetical protein